MILKWRDGLLGRGIGEILWVEVWPGLFTRNPAVGVVLNPLRQLRGRLFSSVGILSGVLLCDTTSFVQLHIYDLTVVVDLCVDLFLIVDVDVWASEGENGAKEGQAPKWKVLDQEVAEEGGDKSSNSGEEVLDEHNSLEFDDDEVQEIMDFLKNAFNVFPWDGIVSPGPHLANYSFVS